MTRLIVCCDGTWNRADQVEDGKPAKTNVRKLFEAIDQPTAEQKADYKEGVGTKRWERLRGGALGFGLSRNVQESYTWLVDNYAPGDELFFFGFSRGAFTARSLAGLVRNSGILKKEHRGMVKDAYDLYRSRKPGDAPWERNAQQFRDRRSHPEAKIKFIGVWDTVGALGIPIDVFRPKWLTDRWAFHDTTLSSAVEHACHAISIDERRKPFKPTLWVHKVDENGAVVPLPEGQTVRQVWFSGVHSDVGGGYGDSSLSDIPLRWMALRAAECGLVYKAGHPITAGADPGGRMHESLSFFYRRLGAYDRRLATPEGTPIDDWVGASARDRYDGDGGYRPTGLMEWLRDRADRVSDV
jgi:uncharacterized protein (DUF2235 family)